MSGYSGFTRGLLVAVATVVIASGAVAEQEQDEAERELAQRLVELQRLEEFFQIEWDYQMQQMEDAMSEYPEAEWSMPEGYMEAMRQQTVEGQVEDWVEAWMVAFDKERLGELVAHLQQPESRAWISDQLVAYPHFLDALVTRTEAMMKVFQEDQGGVLGGMEDAPEPIGHLRPVDDPGLAEVFEFAPGSRIEASMDNGWVHHVRVPAGHAAITEVFSDLEVRLLPDGENAARVVEVRAERAYSSPETCETARRSLTEALSGYFSHSKVSDCGDVRYLAAEGDIRMTLHCNKQHPIGVSSLSLSVSHKPTEDAAYRQFIDRAEISQDQESAGTEESGD